MRRMIDMGGEVILSQKTIYSNGEISCPECRKIFGRDYSSKIIYYGGDGLGGLYTKWSHDGKNDVMFNCMCVYGHIFIDYPHPSSTETPGILSICKNFIQKAFYSLIKS